ncbi:MAG TPA: hypothetical protein VH595_18350 [Verrucomicrobiae bacterium]|jgi:hypothetical protein|nr:hypothetical protein [Verrucomicrobiae bacterium]
MFGIKFIKVPDRGGNFQSTLQPPGKFANMFTEVVFAVYDRSAELETYRAFAERFKGAGM